MPDNEMRLRWCGKIVGTAYVDEDGLAHGILDPMLISEEEVDVIFNEDGTHNMIINVRSE